MNRTMPVLELEPRPERKARFVQHLGRWSLAVALILGPIACAQAGAAAEVPRSRPFTRIYVFGDSLSDTGNLYRLSGGLLPSGFEGRFSNGPLWVEYLAEALGMTIAPEDNFAIGGATTGHLNINNGLNGRSYPGLLDQVATFAATSNPEEAAETLFVVWAGANDFFVALRFGQSPSELIGNGVGNTAQAVQQLWQSGARHILVVNLPDLGLTPMALATGMGPGLTQLSAAYNQALDAALDSLAAAGITTIRVDAFATLREMVGEPARFGFTNVQDPLLVAGGNPDEFLFWDDVHPTTVGHAVFAGAAANSLISFFSPRQGKGTPAALIHCLNGLANASQNN